MVAMRDRLFCQYGWLMDTTTCYRHRAYGYLIEQGKVPLEVWLCHAHFLQELRVQLGLTPENRHDPSMLYPAMWARLTQGLQVEALQGAFG